MKKIKNNEDEVPRPKHNLWPVKMIILTFFIAAVFAFLADLIEKFSFIEIFISQFFGCKFKHNTAIRTYNILAVFISPSNIF